MWVPCPFVHAPWARLPTASTCLGCVWTPGPLRLHRLEAPGILSYGGASTRGNGSWPSPTPRGLPQSPRIPRGPPITYSGNLLGNMLITGFLPFPVSLLHPCYGLNCVPKTGTPSSSECDLIGR